jgi:sulfoxide reductase heme-binding subunit YedZ
MTLPWNDHGGRLVKLKLLVFVALFLPGAWIALGYGMGWLGPRPLNAAILQAGLWALRLLFLALLVTPLRAALDWPRLTLVRRMIGVASFAYAAGHLLLYTADQMFDLVKVASEIVLRIYLTIGFVALLGLAVLAATSTDAMIRRLGGQRWQRLQQGVYALGLIALIHFFLQSKLNVWEPFVMAGCYAWLMAWRLLARRRRFPRRVALAPLAAIGIAAAFATALGEAAWYALSTGAPLPLVLGANLSADAGTRPSWVVLGLAAALTLAAAGRTRLRGGARRLKPA